MASLEIPWKYRAFDKEHPANKWGDFPASQCLINGWYLPDYILHYNV